MDKKTKIGKKLYFHKCCPWVYYTLFIYGHHLPAGYGESLVVLNLKKFEVWDVGLSVDVFITTGLFDMFFNTLDDVNILWEFNNRAISWVKFLLDLSNSACMRSSVTP